MKTLIRYFITTIMLIGVSSCDVNRVPETQLSDEVFWKTDKDLQAACNYLYTFLPSLPFLDDIWSDDLYGRTPNAISEGSRIAPATDDNFNTPYRLIRAANKIIEKAPLVIANGIPALTVDVYIAEARFFRAWGYFLLLQKYGGVPLILKVLKENSDELQAKVNTREEVIQSIYQDLDLAIEKLPTPTKLAGAGYGRISKTAALAFKSRAALFEGTRSKFHGYGNFQSHLTLALAAAKAVIDSKEHSLFGNYFNLFQLQGEGRQNPENILVRQYGVSSVDIVTTHNAARVFENGAGCPTKSLVDSYLMIDGLPITKSPLYKKPKVSTDVFVNRDTRLIATIMKRGDTYITTVPVFTISGLAGQPTGFVSRKYFNIDDWQFSRSTIDAAVIRYAEVLLNYAEAKYELDGGISDADLDLSINLLRTRGGIAKLSNAFINSNVGLKMQDEIRRERRVEFAVEGFRYWDLIRWKTAEIELPKSVLGNYFFKDEFGTLTAVKLTPDNYIINQEARFRKFNPARDYLWPFPVNEIALNPSLEQNPNW